MTSAFIAVVYRALLQPLVALVAHRYQAARLIVPPRHHSSGEPFIGGQLDHGAGDFAGVDQGVRNAALLALLGRQGIGVALDFRASDPAGRQAIDAGVFPLQAWPAWW